MLRTDASDYAVGAVLEQVRDDRLHVPVAFWSRILAEGQHQTWTAREKETYAIVCALRDSWEPPSSFVPRYTTNWMEYVRKENISLDVKDVLVHLVAAAAP